MKKINFERFNPSSNVTKNVVPIYFFHVILQCRQNMIKAS